MTLIVENVGNQCKLSPICFGRDLLNSIYQHFKTEKKWNKIIINFVINDIVLVKNENIPRSFWPLARIIDVHVGMTGMSDRAKLNLI